MSKVQGVIKTVIKSGKPVRLLGYHMIKMRDARSTVRVYNPVFDYNKKTKEITFYATYTTSGGLSVDLIGFLDKQ
jgi:hypothetical protein